MLTQGDTIKITAIHTKYEGILSKKVKEMKTGKYIFIIIGSFALVFISTITIKLFPIIFQLLIEITIIKNISLNLLYLIIIGYIFFFFVMFYFIWNMKSSYDTYFQTMKYLFDKCNINTQHIENIDEILDLTNTASFIFNESKFIKNITFSNEDNLLQNEDFYQSMVEYCYLILIDIRSDIVIRLNEQQQSLESAKSEVKENIKGTTELEKVSELQRARLDKQIEQFEELQRVLVKM